MFLTTSSGGALGTPYLDLNSAAPGFIGRLMGLAFAPACGGGGLEVSAGRLFRLNQPPWSGRVRSRTRPWRLLMRNVAPPGTMSAVSRRSSEEFVMVRSMVPAVAALLAVLSQAGCAPTLDLAVGFRHFSFNERLRPDLAPLEAAQEQGEPLLFSDADQTASLVSGLYPAAPGIPAADLRGLGHATTLWVPGGTRFVLSYEGIAHDPLFNGRALGLTVAATDLRVLLPLPKARQITLGGRGVTDPRTRQVAVYLSEDAIDTSSGRAVLDTSEIRVLGDRVPQVLQLGSALFSVALEQCTGGAVRRHRDAPPGRLGEDCGRTLLTRDLCEGRLGANSLFPSTVLNCALGPSLTPLVDTSFRLVATSPGNATRPLADTYPGTTQQSLALLDVKVADTNRLLRRHAIQGPEECQMPDGQGGRMPCDPVQLDQLLMWRMCTGRIPIPRGTRLNCASVRAGPQGYAEIAGVWTFSAGDPQTGQFRENFLDGVAVKQLKIRIDARDRNSVGRYLMAEEVTDLRVVQGRGSGDRCEVTAEAGTGHAVINPNACRSVLRPFTVAWAKGVRDVPSTWKLIQRVQAEPSVVIGRYCNRGAPCQDLLATNVLRRDLSIRPGEQLVFEFIVGPE